MNCSFKSYSINNVDTAVTLKLSVQVMQCRHFARLLIDEIFSSVFLR